MSADDDSGSVLPDRVRTVTAPSDTRPNAQMNTIGWLIFAGLVLLLLPVLPLLALIWLISKATDSLSPS